MKLLHFKAAWCSPCKKLDDLLQNVVFPFEKTVIDIDEDIDTALKYNVRSVPTLILIDDKNNIVQTHLGMVTLQQLKDKFLNTLGK